MCVLVDMPCSFHQKEAFSGHLGVMSGWAILRLSQAVWGSSWGTLFHLGAMFQPCCGVGVKGGVPVEAKGIFNQKGVFWRHHGAILVLCRAILDHLGAIFGYLGLYIGAILRPCCAIWEPSWGMLGPLGATFGPRWGHAE